MNWCTAQYKKTSFRFVSFSHCFVLSKEGHFIKFRVYGNTALVKKAYNWRLDVTCVN